MTLLDEVLATYGGVDHWRDVDTIRIHQTVGGVLWPLKGVGGILDDSTVQITVQEQHAWHSPLPMPGLRSHYRPGVVEIEHDDDEHRPVEALRDPRASFAGHTLESPWTPAQLAYFSGYAMWTYLTEPYQLTFPGVRTEELGTWREDGQTWRRLGVRYPDSIATHSADQVLYVDGDGLLRRRDYQVDIAGGSPAAHYMEDHQFFDGIVLPLRRTVHPCRDDGLPDRSMVTVSVDINDVRIG
ncbi:hypothetical protein A5757_08830 [Mycobacterium sp. 852013-51886_SCH5428379]|uniref:hypothetical protein n=1 Tax=Mycobacterium sp. 852013-51886_SCH5428379 TaxID=1834111 RepID=UPI0008007DD4|nr:hypothetical protein [Mycobacterium sp. 852013-51886_SCH5428379]OBB60652.1 hypothetical protein A5757_08830 [Mycobacterium sp. 852013-51886_SCH5428379]